MFKMEISGATPELLKSNIIALAKDFEDMVSTQMVLGIPETIPAQVPVESEAPKAKAKATKEKKPTPAKEEAVVQAAAPAAPAPSASLDDIKKDLAALIATGKEGYAKGYELFKKHGATKASELKPENYGEFSAELKELLSKD